MYSVVAHETAASPILSGTDAHNTRPYTGRSTSRRGSELGSRSKKPAEKMKVIEATPPRRAKGRKHAASFGALGKKTVQLSFKSAAIDGRSAFQVMEPM
jgi:hypothetical protein